MNMIKRVNRSLKIEYKHSISLYQNEIKPKKQSKFTSKPCAGTFIFNVTLLLAFIACVVFHNEIMY
jgi:hypothetical protein